MDIGNLDLSILIAYKLRRNWSAHLRLIMVVPDVAEHDNARRFFDTLLTVARIPGAEVIIIDGTFDEAIARVDPADLSIFGMISDPDIDFARRMVEATDSSCIFVRDSGQESALA
jgi:solute carrier family 12 (sodium/potassium/chloride transporter), member 2